MNVYLYIFLLIGLTNCSNDQGISQSSKIKISEPLGNTNSRNMKSLPSIPIKRLSNLEIEASLAAIFGPDIFANFPWFLPEEEYSDFFHISTDASSQTTEDSIYAMEKIATFLGQNYKNITYNLDDKSELAKMITDYALLLWRKKIEKDSLEKIIATASTLNTPAEKLTSSLYFLLVSPYFLTHWENNESTDETLSQANRLSFLLNNIAADKKFVDDYKKKGWSDLAQATVSAAGIPLKYKFSGFIRQWLNLEFYDSYLDKNLDKDFTFNKKIGQEILDSFLKTMVDDFVDGKLNFQDLLLTDSFYINQDIAPCFNLTASSKEMQLVTLKTHKGILSHCALSLVGSEADQTSIIRRGNFVYSRLLGQSVGSPPDDFDIPDKNTGATNRENIENLTTASDGCKTCHTKLNPIGYALEIFDYLGRHRGADNGKAIDGSGSVDTSPSLKFKDYYELIQQLAQSPLGYRNFVRQMYKFYLQKEANDQDIEFLSKIFSDNSYHLKPLLISIANYETNKK